jgi:hypothetical protein
MLASTLPDQLADELDQSGTDTGSQERRVEVAGG